MTKDEVLTKVRKEFAGWAVTPIMSTQIASTAFMLAPELGTPAVSFRMTDGGMRINLEWAN